MKIKKIDMSIMMVFGVAVAMMWFIFQQGNINWDDVITQVIVSMIVIPVISVAMAIILKKKPKTVGTDFF